MPNRPTRPGKHAARHKAPTAFSRATAHLASTGGRRTGGTVLALGAVVLAGAAGNGATSYVVSASSSGKHRHAEQPPPRPNSDMAQQRAAEVTGDVSRSQARTPLRRALAERRDPAEQPASTTETASHTARAASIVPDDPRAIAESMLSDYGWDSSDEMSCLDELWVSESGWDVYATNPTSGAYGIPQALPAGKMASAGSDWRTNPATQIEWGLDYIQSSYGSPCSAWDFKQSNGWY